MKTSKRKRSSKSEPIVEASEAADATAAAASAEAAVVAAVAANDSVVAEAAATEFVAAEAVATELLAPEAVAAEAVAPESLAATESLVVNEPAVATESAVEPAVATESAVEPEPVAGESTVAASEPVVVLAANCSVKDAATLKTSLCAVSNETAAVTVDASAVERVDTATMQLLCAFVRDRSSRNQSVMWRGQSRALHDAVRLLGVGRLLGFEEANGVAA